MLIITMLIFSCKTKKIFNGNKDLDCPNHEKEVEIKEEKKKIKRGKTKLFKKQMKQKKIKIVKKVTNKVW